MNILKKIYCRIFQKSFKIAIPFLPYRKPRQLDSNEELAHVLNRKNISCVMIITDASVYSLGLIKGLESCLKKENISYVIYDKTVANPTTVNVEEARSLYLEKDCKALIGFGGGSSIDCAKAVGARIVKPKKSLAKMEGLLRICKRLTLLIAIPTTAGTGSETTLAAVITDAKTRHKYPINDFSLIPHYAVLDPEVTRTLPPFLTATTGMDALTHAVEAYIGGSTTKETRQNALKAVSLIFTYLRPAYQNGNNIKARRKMLYASFLAGAAFTKSYVGYVHAVAHSLGGKYNTPHGLANAVLLPHVLEAYGKSAYKKLHELGICAGVCDIEDSHQVGAERFIEAIKQLKIDLNIPDYIEEIQEKDIPKLAKYADKEGNPLYPVPKLMNAKELERFYYEVMR